MFSFTELHIKLAELQKAIRSQDHTQTSKYLEALEQIDKIIISLDILNHQPPNN